MTRALPAWAQAIVPVDMDEAALLLGVSRRFLVDEIKNHPHYDRRGSKKVFYPEHIAELREALKCRASKSHGGEGSPMPLGPSPANAFEKALELATKAPPKNSGRSSKPGSGNVIPMARKPSGHSRKRP